MGEGMIRYDPTSEKTVREGEMKGMIRYDPASEDTVRQGEMKGMTDDAS